MKKLAVLLLTVCALSAQAEAEMKKVCHDKNGKQVCKMIKVHKKLEGNDKVPTKPVKK